MVRIHTTTAAAAVSLAALAVVDAVGAPTPWPFGEAPRDAELSALVEGAVVLADRERLEEFLEARDQGEDSEHIVLRQADIDQKLYEYHTLRRLFLFGDALFAHEFRAEDGYGDSFLPQLRRVHNGVRGGLDTFSCAGCHSVGGADGAGALTQNAFLGGDGDRFDTTNVRNAPHALGLGFVQALGAEMTAELATLREKALSDAVKAGQPVTVPLWTKGVEFGELVAFPDGQLDTQGVDGVDPDLIVRPFGWKGDIARLRRFIEEAARVHFGVQAHTLALEYEKNPDVDHLGPGPDWWDPDNDGKPYELHEGILTAGAVYLSMIEAPVVVPPFSPELKARWARGEALFEKIGCASCHRRSLTLSSTSWTELPDTTDGEGIRLDLATDGDSPRSGPSVELFSDLKRHDMGAELADPYESPSGLPRAVFLTRPLWGLAETPPYMHDGRAPTIPAAILAHGGEAEWSRTDFSKLSPTEQADVHIFLLSLTRYPKPRVAR